MPRRPRVFIAGLSVHIINRGVDHLDVFRDDADRETFVTILRRAAQRHGVAVHGYVLMTTHYHGLVTPIDARALPGAMKELGVRYARYFNRKYERIGTLWSSRYRGILVPDDRYWLTCLRYIEQNPVRAGIVERPDDYAWSSFLAHTATDSDWLASHCVYDELGHTARDRRLKYREFCTTPLTETDLAAQRLDSSSP